MPSTSPEGPGEGEPNAALWKTESPWTVILLFVVSFQLRPLLSMRAARESMVPAMQLDFEAGRPSHAAHMLAGSGATLLKHDGQSNRAGLN